MRRGHHVTVRGADPSEGFLNTLLALIGRFIAHYTRSLGWTAERFELFDSDIANAGRGFRETEKPERMGKKCQWIGWRTIQVFLVENYYLSTGDYYIGVKSTPKPKSYGDLSDLDESLLDPVSRVVKPHVLDNQDSAASLAQSRQGEIAPDRVALPRSWPEPMEASAKAWLQDPNADLPFRAYFGREEGRLPAVLKRQEDAAMG